MRNNLSTYKNILLSLLLGCSVFGTAQTLDKNFKNPPSSSKPRTWMHAMSGNMSKEGLSKDLEAMSEAGIGGLLLFNITQGIPNGRVVYNSPEHHEMIKHAASEAERLGLSFGVHNCDGWSSSGGPWITPENAMKMVVWSEQIVTGGKNTKIQLKQATIREGFYKDIAVIAYPSLPSELLEHDLKPSLSASHPNIDLSVINDGLRHETSQLLGSKDEKPWIQFSYEKPFTARSAFVLHTERQGKGEIQISDDGVNFRHAHTLKPVRTGKGEWAMNDHFNPITARHFRFVLENERDHSLNIKEIELRAVYFFDNPLGRTAMARTELKEIDPIGTPEKDMVIAQNSIRDLSAFMDEKGMLTTKLPKGNWTILRFGYTATGAFNNPASNEGRGLETDKLSKKATEIHFNAFSKKVIDNTKKLAPNALQYIEIDSYEMGGQNWTDGFETIFKERHNYHITPFLPCFAGRFVDDPETTEAVLWDLRQTICDLMTNNYYEYFTELCHQNGVLSYVEPYGFGPVNELDVGGKTDIPMGEFWMNRDMPMVPPAVSSAHIYGKPVISAESFTSTPEINWKGHPAMAKSSGDKAWAKGINEFMFHRFAHQANPHVVPGMTMSRWGFHFDRTQTWWYNAGAAWFKYIARGSYLLRQGVPVSDLLVFVGETAPNGTFSYENLAKQLPQGFKFDNVNADVLLNRITLQQGKITLPEGTEYKALVLKDHTFMSIALLQKLKSIVEHGITLIGEKPESLAGYMHGKNDQDTFNQLVTDIWNNPNTFETQDWASVFTQQNIQPDLLIEGHPDLEFAHRKTNNADIYFIYNPDSIPVTYSCSFRIDGKIPELWNPNTGSISKIGNFYHHLGNTKLDLDVEREGSVFVVFREASNQASPLIKVAGSSDQKLIMVELQDNEPRILVDKNDEYIATFKDGSSKTFTVKSIPNPLVLNGAWDLSFNKAGGFETRTVFPELIDWKNHTLDGIRHYSGTASYKKQFNLPENFVAGDQRIFIDLGNVNIVASVTINGKDLGVLWKKPFHLDITDAVHAGENEILINLTNQWSNRLIGEERYPANDGGYRMEGARPENKMPEWYLNNEPRPAGQRTTFTTAPFYKATDPLVSSGLQGPVQIMVKKIITITK